ncbi:IPT/TIG domain-containing protein [Termitidicoccus mucosus]|uniref:IPT/TIG domain-containing protein n=1 Tax=Termitidicoccus mucosus TaxID=1184151 RepID=A0A178ILX4_9BACT|nr:hypothetical protein AW736_06215 [Opitutaceae bacterium TSB47]
MNTTRTSRISALLSLFAAVFAQAAPVATDNFDSYTAGATLVGGTAGAGWSAAWTGQGAYANIVSGTAGAITYTLDNGEVRGGGNALKITAPSDAENIGVLERAVPEITDGGDVFVSLVFKIKSGSAAGGVDQFDGVTFTTNNNVYYYAGDGAKSPTADAAGYAGYQGKAGARLAGGWQAVNKSLVIGQTYFLVIRYSGWNVGANQKNTYDIISTWLNPTTNDEGIPSTTTNGGTSDNTVAITRVGDSVGYGSTKFSSLYLNTIGLGPEYRFHIIDDIRVGRTWADVVGIPMPVVTAITPSSAMAGDPVILTGKSLGDVSVTIGGIAAVITSQSATSLTVTVPASLGLGGQQVVVTGPGGSVTKTLTIIRPPILDSATPGSGIGGDTVVLAGRNLEESAVTIGGLPAAITSNTGTELAIVIPAGLANGAQTITVSTNAGVATIAFTNTAPTPPAPVVSGVDSPTSRAGASVTLSGSDLAGAISVTVGGIAAEITSRANGALTITIPAGLANGEHPVVITTAGGETTTTLTLTDLIATDDFSGYTAGAAIAGVSAGTGWAGAWAANAGVTVTGDPADTVTYTLSNGTVLGGGQALKLALDTPLLGTFPRVLERNLARPVTTGEDVFVSFVCKIKNPATPDGSPVSTTDNVTSVWLAKDAVPDTRYDTHAYVGYTGKVGANIASPSSTTFVSTGLKAGQPCFVVLRYGGWDGSSYKKCRVWLNPANNDETAVSTTLTNERTASTAGYGSEGFLGLCVDTLGINSAGRYQVIDDLRVGYTWAAVTGPRTAFIAADNFDSYVPGAKLAGASGGAGWDGPWSAQSPATVTGNPADAVTYTLDNGTVRGGGNALKITGTGADVATTVAGVLERRFARVPAGDDVYASFVFKIKNPAIPDGSPLSGNTCALWYAADATKDPDRDIAAFAGYGGKAGGKLSAGWQTVTTPLVAGQTYFLVIRYSGWNSGVQAYDTCRVWLNPATNDEAATDPAITTERAGNSAGYGNTDIRGLYVSTLGLVAGGAYHIVDDIRVGSTWESVVGEPVPAYAPGTPPTLDALPSADIAPGSSVTLTGSNFAGLVRVMIGGVEAEITAASDSAITVTVPVDAVCGSVAVFTAAGSCIPAETLSLATPPVFASVPPASQVAVEGRPVNLAAPAWASGNISYTWQCRPSATATWESVPGDICTGADSAILSLTVPADKNSWQFRCVASTRAGSVESPPATLVVVGNLLAAPAGLAAGSGSSARFVYVTDRAAHTVSVLAPDGGLAPLAGVSGTSGDNDGPGSTARFDQPRGLALSPAGTLLVADSGNGLLRSVALDASAVQTLGATGSDAWLASPSAVVADAAGTAYIADTGNHLIKRLDNAGVMEILAGSGVSGTDNGPLLEAKFNTPAALAFSASGTLLYVADAGNHVIRVVDLAAGQVSTFAGRMASRGATDGDALSAASFDSPAGLALDDSGGLLYVADTGNSRIRVITTGTARSVATLAGSAPGFRDGPGADAWFNAPEALALAPDGALYVADTGNGVIRRVASGADALVSTPALKAVAFPPSDGSGPDDNKAGGGGGGAPSAWLLLALAVCAALRGRGHKRNS